MSTKTGGIENIVIDNKSALLSENNDLNSFSKNLLTLINNPSKREFLSRHGEVKSKEFHYSNLVTNIKKLYKF